MHIRQLSLFKPAVGMPVRLAEDGQEEGARVLMVTGVAHPWVLIADQEGNKGTSVTNAVKEYAQAACRIAGHEIGNLSWFERDSIGRYDRVAFHPDGTVKFHPIKDPEYVTSTWEAMRAYLQDRGFELDEDATAALTWVTGLAHDWAADLDPNRLSDRPR